MPLPSCMLCSVTSWEITSVIFDGNSLDVFQISNPVHPQTEKEIRAI